tara:strand:+ start:584 stop:1003 length:420 start_codon:yes stop_codon:yes gene_type:complete
MKSIKEGWEQLKNAQENNRKLTKEEFQDNPFRIIIPVSIPIIFIPLIVLFYNTKIKIPEDRFVPITGTYSFTDRDGKRYELFKNYTYCETYPSGIKCTFNGTVTSLDGYFSNFSKVVNCSKSRNNFCKAAEEFGQIIYK